MSSRSGAQRNDLRQGIQQPHDEAQLLKELNSKHTVVQIGGKVKVLTEEIDPIEDRLSYTFSDFADIKKLYSNQVVDRLDQGSWWLNHPERRQYKGVVFAPYELKDKDCFNLWQGFAVTP